MESVGVPEDVSTRRPATERRKAARAKTEFKLENGIRMTLIGCGMTQGFTLLLLLLALFTLATTWRNVSSTLYSQHSKRIIYHSLTLANKRWTQTLIFRMVIINHIDKAMIFFFLTVNSMWIHPGYGTTYKK